jgi:hypothetical protein
MDIADLERMTGAASKRGDLLLQLLLLLQLAGGP